MSIENEIINRSQGFFPKLYSFLRFFILPIENIDAALPRIGKIIDYGCGFGANSCYFALSKKKRKVLGVEFIRKRVKKALVMSQGIRNLKFKQGDISKMDIGYADAHVLIDVLHHINYEKQLILLNNIIRKMKKGDLIVIKDIDNHPYIKYLWNYLHDKVMTLNGRLYFRSQKWLEDFFNEKGLSTNVIRCENLLYPHFIILAKK